MVDTSSPDQGGYYREDEVECIGGPLDGLTVSVHPLMNARFWLDCEDGKKAWYQYGIIGYPHKALYLSTTN